MYFSLIKLLLLFYDVVLNHMKKEPKKDTFAS